MKTARLSSLLTAALLVIYTALPALAQNQTVNGTLQVSGSTTLSGALNVTGAADFGANTTNFGTRPDDTTQPGFVLTYTDPNSGQTSTISFGASRTNNTWQWQRNSAGGLIPQMTLTSTNSIILWSPTVSNSAGIILDPAGDSTFSGSITATGTNSRLPNQQISTDTASVLTVGLADGRYLTASGAETIYLATSQGDARYINSSDSNIPRLNQNQTYTGVNTFNGRIQQTGLNVYNSNQNSQILNFGDANGSWKLSSTIDNQDYVDQERICIRNTDSQTQPSLAFYDSNNIFLGQYGSYNVNSYVAQWVVPTQYAPGLHMGFDRNLWITGGPTPSNGVGPYYMSLDKEEGIKFYQWVEFQTRVDAIDIHMSGKLTVASDSTISGSLLLTGTNSQMPNQQITSTASILTKKLADDLYLPITATTTSPYLTTTAASTTYLTSAQAASSYIPVGASVLNIGYGTSVTGSYSTALGYYTVAAGSGQLVIGQYNIAQGDSSNWVSTDNLFVIGNGTSNSNRTNAFEIKKNGDVNANGNMTVTGRTTTRNFKVLDAATFSGMVYASSAIRINPSGDISMGDFTSGDLTAAQIIVNSYSATLAAASTTLSSIERQNITNFLNGLEALVGLENVTECWSFRNTQNATNNLAAYGMLSQYSAALINNPIWTSDGIALNGTSQYIDLLPAPLTQFPVGSTIIIVFNCSEFTPNGVVRPVMGFSNFGYSNEIKIFDDASLYAFGKYTNSGETGYVFPTGTVTLNKNHVAIITTGTNKFSVLYDGLFYNSSFANGLTNMNSAGLVSGRNLWGWGDFFKGKIVFCAVMQPVDGTYDKHMAIYSLYKSTIGQGLGLP